MWRPRQRHKTSILSKALLPRYETKIALFDFVVYASIMEKIRSLLELVGWDKDLIGKNCLSERYIPAREWFALGGRFKGFEFKKIKVRVVRLRSCLCRLQPLCSRFFAPLPVVLTLPHSGGFLHFSALPLSCSLHPTQHRPEQPRSYPRHAHQRIRDPSPSSRARRQLTSDSHRSASIDPSPASASAATISVQSLSKSSVARIFVRALSAVPAATVVWSGVRAHFFVLISDCETYLV